MLRFTLTFDSVDYVLNTEPHNYRDVTFTIKRDKTWFGFLFDFSGAMEFTFCGGGAEVLELAFLAEGIEAQIDVLIEEALDGENFITLDTGKVNLESRSEEGQFISANIESTGISQTVRSRSDIKINLQKLTAIDGDAMAATTFGFYDFTLHSKSLAFKSEMLDKGAEVQNFSQVVELPQGEKIFLQTESKAIVNELTQTTDMIKVLINANVSAAIEDQPVTSFHTTDNQDPVLLPSTYNLDWTIKGDFVDTNNGGTSRLVGVSGGATDIQLFLFYGPDPIENTTIQAVLLGTIPGYNQTSGIPPSTRITPFNFVGTSSINMNPDDRMWMVWIFNYDVTSGTAGVFQSIDITIDYSGIGDGLEFNFDVISVLDDSLCKAFMVHEAFARVLNSITGIADPLTSSIFGRKNSEPASYPENGCESFNMHTIGKQIRAFVTKPITLSLNDLFDIWHPMGNIGIGIEGQKVVIERKAYFFDQSMPTVTLDFVDDLTMKVDTERLYNKIQVGYDKWETEEVEAERETNSKREYVLPLKQTRNNYDIVAKCTTGAYPIEWTRRKAEKRTTDWKYDDIPFVIATNRSVDGGGIPTSLNVAEKDENFTSITGYEDAPTAYNLRHFPERILLKHMDMIGVAMEKKQGEDIQFSSGEGNVDVDSALTGSCRGTFSGASLGGDDDIQWDDPNIVEGTPFVMPHLWSFSTNLTRAQYFAIRDSPKTQILASCTDADHTAYFIESIEWNASKRRAEFICSEVNV